MSHPSIQAVSAVFGRAALVCLCLSGAAHAADQDPAALQRHAEKFLKAQANGLPGKLSVSVKPPRSTLEACDALEAFALPANHILTMADLMLREGDLGLLTADVANNAEAIVGYRTVSGLAANAPLRSTLLRSPLVVQQGQTTRIVLNGPGFSVQSEGMALANASKGDRVRVKTASGQVVSGIAQDGQQVIVAY
ncbi:MAG: putative flagella basal body P-ring formation protein [Proteobacteria bacterium]|nr:putative flagella basal body P-ring formation protein [Pseudomonadota bacterium]